MISGSNFPEGKRIAFTGRLASMSRAAVTRCVIERGGLVRNLVSKFTDVLVVGADGWPLRSTGAVTRNLHRASKLQEAGFGVSIVGEAEFLRSLCGCEADLSIRREHTLEQLSRLLDVSGLRLRRWIAIGLIKPVDGSALTPTFDYEQVAGARTLSRLVARGVAPSKLAGSLRQLQKWLPDDRQLGVSIVAIENQLLARDGDELIDSHGQLHFAFDNPSNASHHSSATAFACSLCPDQLFDKAHQHELDHELDNAIADYRNWLKNFGDDHEVLFNLATVYSRKGQLEQAIQCYQRSVEILPTYASAWNNLGLCMHQTGEHCAAILALRRAVDLDPDNMATIFNLADMLDEAGNSPEARLLWLRIVKHEEQVEDEIKQYAIKRISNGNLDRMLQ